MIAPSCGARFEAGKDTGFVHDGRDEGGGQGRDGQGELGAEIRSLEEVVDVSLVRQHGTLDHKRGSAGVYPSNKICKKSGHTRTIPSLFWLKNRRMSSDAVNSMLVAATRNTSSGVTCSEPKLFCTRSSIWLEAHNLCPLSVGSAQAAHHLVL